MNIVLHQKEELLKLNNQVFSSPGLTYKFNIPETKSDLDSLAATFKNAMNQEQYVNLVLSGEASIFTIFADFVPLPLAAGLIYENELHFLLGVGNTFLDQSDPDFTQSVIDVLKKSLLVTIGKSVNSKRFTVKNISRTEAEEKLKSRLSLPRESRVESLLAYHSCVFFYPGFGHEEWCRHNGCKSSRSIR